MLFCGSFWIERVTQSCAHPSAGFAGREGLVATSVGREGRFLQLMGGDCRGNAIWDRGRHFGGKGVFIHERGKGEARGQAYAESR